MKTQPSPADDEEKRRSPKSRRPISAAAIAWRVLRLILVTYLAACLLAMLFEGTLMFPAARYPQGDWEPWGVELEDAEITAADGTRLHGWYLPADDPRAYVLFCHGNAGNITDRVGLVQYLRDELNVSVLVFDYRGYGKSRGRPNEKGIIADGRAARDWLAARAGIAPADVVLMGRSLGGAVAVALAAEQRPRGLILESTFSSMTDVAAYHFPILPVRWLLRNRFNSLARIQNFDGPLLASHSKWDEVVPYQFGRKLFEAVPSEAKQWIEFDRLRHNDGNPPEYYDQLDRFLDELPKVVVRSANQTD